MKHAAVGWLAALLAAFSYGAHASELSYTFIDFLAINTSVDATGAQTPVPGQTVQVDAGGGNGIAVAGGLDLPGRFYAAGRFTTSVVDVDGVVTSPLAVAEVSGEFDLLTSTLALGYVYELGPALDLVAELSYDATEYDFGSFAGEELDLDDSGLGARVGVRWNPAPAFELFTSVKHSPVAEPMLDQRTLESETRLQLGARWYLFEDLGIGLEYESGSASAVTLSMRFSFGSLPW